MKVEKYFKLWPNFDVLNFWNEEQSSENLNKKLVKGIYDSSV